MPANDEYVWGDFDPEFDLPADNDGYGINSNGIFDVLDRVSQIGLNVATALNPNPNNSRTNAELQRQQAAVQRQAAGQNTEDIARVDEFLRLPALIDFDDCDVWLGDPATQARVALTVEQEAPGVIVADPLANFAPGDIAKPGEMKEAIRTLLGIIRRVAPKAAVLLLHHARTGRQNIAQGVGWDAGNFGLGGKALFSAARCQLNLMPGKADNDSHLVLSCAKANNCQRFEVRGLRFDPVNFSYALDAEFDADAWRADVEGKARAGQSLCTVAAVTSAVRDGYTSTKDLVAHLSEACAASKRSVERVISRSVDCAAIKPLTRGKFILGRKSARFLEATP